MALICKSCNDLVVIVGTIEHLNLSFRYHIMVPSINELCFSTVHIQLLLPSQLSNQSYFTFFNVYDKNTVTVDVCSWILLHT